MQQDFKGRINYLKEIINKANNFYYKGEPIMSDEEYDSLYKELEELQYKESESLDTSSPLNNIGYELADTRAVSPHKYKMYSLNKVHSKEDLSKWLKNIIQNYPDINFVCEPKIDGAAISITYQDKSLISARTRGDGERGVLISDTVKNINNIPIQINYPNYHLPELLEIRGEVYIPLDKFREINKVRQKEGLETFSNPRNLASSTLNTNDSNIAKNRYLSFIPYDIQGDNLNLSQTSKLELLNTLGFELNKHIYYINNSDDILQIIEQWDTKRGSTNYLNDGLVIKVDPFDICEILGHTYKYPKWAIAYKYPEEHKESKLLDVKFQVGPSGLITPIAIFEPTEISGSIISRATLHNESFITLLDLYIGDIVLIKKAGEVIPKVIGNRRTTGSLNKVNWVINCPICQSTLNRESDKRSYCINISCPSIIKQNIVKFCSSEALDIKGIGPTLIDKLLEHNLIKDPFDLFSITESNLLELPNVKKKSANNFITSINKARDKELYRFIYSLNIPSLGLVNSINLCREINSLNSILSLSYEDLINIEGIGDINARKILDWITLPTNKNSIRKVFSICNNFNVPSVKNNFTKVYLTGKVPGYNKKEIKRILPGSFTLLDKFNTGIDILILGLKPSNSKIENCKKKGIIIKDWDSFLAEYGIHE